MKKWIPSRGWHNPLAVIPGKPPPEPPRRAVPAGTAPRSSRLLLIAIALLLVSLAAAGVILVGADADRQGVASPSPSASVAATSTASPGPSASGGHAANESPSSLGSASASASASAAESATDRPPDPAIASQIEQIEAQVVPIRGLERRRPVPARILGQAALERELRRSFAKDNPPELVEAQQNALIRLGFLPPGTDLAELVLDLLGSQVIGFYDPDTDSLAVIDRHGRFGPLERITLAHEYTHALQDQTFNLESLDRDDPTQSDRNLARLALLEGDATLAMSQWAARHLSPEELAEVGRSGAGEQAEALERVPPILREQLRFPYDEGVLFVSQLWTRGAWEAVDEAYGKLPDSTEQILHPEKYRAGERPTQVELPPIEQRLGEGWRRVLIDTLGELDLRIWLDQALDLEASGAGAAGWAGDRLASYEGPADAWAIAWETAWDTPADADEFLAGARPVTGTLAGSATVEAVPGDEPRVRVLVASDAEVLRRLSESFSR